MQARKRKQTRALQQPKPCSAIVALREAPLLNVDVWLLCGHRDIAPFARLMALA